MEKSFARFNRWLILGGLGQIIFGSIVLVVPGISLEALTLVFGAFALTYGLFALGAGLNLLAHKSTEWVPFVIGGLGGVLVGVVTFLSPGITALALAYLIAANAFIAGVSMIVAAIDLKDVVSGAGWLALDGVFSVAFGVLVAAQPGAGLLAILWLIAAYAIVTGVARLVAAWKINQVKGDVSKVFQAAQPSRS